MIDFDLLREEYAKCYMDTSRIYMIENYLRTFDATQGREIPFKLFPRQQDICRVLGTKANLTTTKPRQAGITTTCSAYIACEMALADPETPKTVLCIGNTLDLAQQFLDKVRDFLLQLPLWVWGDVFNDLGHDILMPPKNKKIIFDISNSKELLLKNGSRVVARSSGPDASRGVGGVSYLIFDEAAFIENALDVYTAALPTVSTGGQIIMVSTPNGKDPLYYETCRRAALKGTADWNNFELLSLKWYQDPRYNKYLEWTRKNAESGQIEIISETIIDDKGSVAYDMDKWGKMVQDGWKPRSPWYLKMCRQFNNDSQKIAQELDVSFLGSANNVVDPELIDMQAQLNVRDPKYVDPLEENTWIWKEAIEGHRYIMSIDCLPEGQKVLTKNGLVSIENVGLKDILIDKDGNETNIINKQTRLSPNEETYAFKLFNFGREITFTKNHPIWSSTDNKLKRCYKRHDNEKYNFNERYWEHDFKYNKACELKKGDWIEIPNLYVQKVLSEQEIFTQWAKYENVYGKEYEIENPLMNERFWRYVGMWLAEGYVQHGTDLICTVHHTKEVDYIKSIVEDLFKRTAYDKPCETGDNSMPIQFSCKPVAHFLSDTFGMHCYGKRIPEWVKFLPNNLKMGLVKGYLEGGNCISKNNGGTMVRMTSVSLDIIEGIQDILLSNGIVGNVSTKHQKEDITDNKSFISRIKYEMSFGAYDTIKLCNNLGIDCDNHTTKDRRMIKELYFSKDFKKIYTKIQNVEKSIYIGFVYNFETASHSFCCKNIATHNCSRGDTSDFTALEIIDMDGADEDGTPILEQVLEYHGKMSGNQVADIAYQYGCCYNNALAIVDCIGGYGDACVLGLRDKGYIALYYDDPEMKTYMVEREMTRIQSDRNGRLPGFHTGAVRYQMLSSFANMVKTNQFKVRSKRVIAELDTWIYTKNRIDHQNSAHDDTLTCLAMGLWVMNTNIRKAEQAHNKVKMMLKAYVSANSSDFSSNNITEQSREEGVARKAYNMPIYSPNSQNKVSRASPNANYDWLLK